ncbi:hypothetical protein D9619_006494 [Psilocybe cf. subviscida]|uniref:Uncharacterized protein n=1 Tax=Psilocybe cf. subviscida TaxID=2480587 RepID=A0A8H5B4E5_9AGAR|nr:hypothetical protein D9619_006494 [Psilocybe cf. subviscida]
MIPVSLMRPPDAPQTRREWIDKNLPLTYWHVTHFAQERSNGAEFIYHWGDLPARWSRTRDAEKAYTLLPDKIRDEAALAGNDQVPISIADVISALISKTVYADAPPTNFLQLSSIASVRRF